MPGIFPAPNARVGAGHSTKTMHRTRNTLPRDEKDIILAGTRGTAGYRELDPMVTEGLNERSPFQQKMNVVGGLFTDKVMHKKEYERADDRTLEQGGEAWWGVITWHRLEAASAPLHAIQTSKADKDI